MIVRTGNDLLCATLERLGARHVFGMPGSQNTALFESLRASSIQVVVNTSELAAAFCANGYARASGEVGVLVTIPGPGFLYAFPGLAEAAHDSAALLHIVGSPGQQPGNRYRLQAIDQRAIAQPLVKAFFEIDEVDQLVDQIVKAYHAARTGGPGPVVLQIAPSVLDAAVADAQLPAPAPPTQPSSADLDLAVSLLRGAKRPAVFAGLGASGAAKELRTLVEDHEIPVFTTLSGRGVLPEDHHLSLGFDFLAGDVQQLNAFVSRADAILAIGCRMSHNGTAGFQLQLPEDRLIHVDTDSGALGANYGTRLAICDDARHFLTELRSRWPRTKGERAWPPDEVAQWRTRLRARIASWPEPTVEGAEPATPAGFFELLHTVLPRDGILVTDSGLHQVLSRFHHVVRAPRGFLPPSNFQSMGYGVPAAIGAKLAAPHRPVVALIGDGGFMMSGNEIRTAVCQRVPVVFCVFNDGNLGLIRMQQLSDAGRTHGVDVAGMNLRTWAAAAAIRYLRLDEVTAEDLQAAILGREPVLLEVRVADSPRVRVYRTRALLKRAFKRVGDPRRWVSWIGAAFHGAFRSPRGRTSQRV